MRSILLNHIASAAKVPIPSVSQSFEPILLAVSKTTRRQWWPGKDSFSYDVFFSQIALAIGVLTSNRRGGGCTSWRIEQKLPLPGAIAGCHC